MQFKGRRMRAGNRIIGFEDSTTWRSKKAFSRVKAIYGEELERFLSEKPEMKPPVRKLSQEEKLAIKERVKRQIRRERQKEYLIWIMFIITALLLFIILKFLVFSK